MRFGGHETFHIRDGWLYKGLRLLSDNPELFHSPDAADALGVGGNMAKSIRHWLLAVGLASRGENAKADIAVSSVGRIIRDNDPYFTSAATWWALHINLVNNPDFAVSWDWFFNYSGQSRFEKGVAIEQLKRYLHRSTNARVPAGRTLERDFSVLLNTYARVIPAETTDPEDSKDCPFQDLELISFFRESGFYRINFAEKPIPPEILGYALAKRFPSHDGRDGDVSVSIADAANTACSPGKTFCLRAESVFDLALKAETALDDGWLRVTGLAGSRHINFRPWPAAQWLEEYYRKEAKNEETWLQNQKGDLLKA